MTNNELIADFIGFQKTNLGWFDNEETMNFKSDGNTYDSYELKFHSSWDWLMPVISKCRTESNSENDYWEGIYYTLEECDIDITYPTVVEFIKRTNLNQQ